MKLARLLVCGAALAVAPPFNVVAWIVAQGAPPAGRGGPPAQGAMGNELVESVRATKGCLGVETAFTSTRKSVIFAWFEDKAATMRWYESDYHQTMMMGMTDANAEPSERGPLEHVPDDVPVLCIATITPSTKPMIPGFPAPISQVSIELYTPLPGGLALNGRFAPESLKVADMVVVKLPAAPAAPAASPPAEGGAGAGAGGGKE